jgi:hypothetical protein
MLSTSLAKLNLTGLGALAFGALILASNPAGPAVSDIGTAGSDRCGSVAFDGTLAAASHLVQLYAVPGRLTR